MNANQKLHQASLELWAERIKDHAASNLTISEWCARNNLSIHAYNYWKHKLKEEYVSSILPDIVQIPSETSVPTLMEDSSSNNIIPSCESSDSGDSRNVSSTHTVSISVGDLSIQAGASVSDEMLMNLIKAVRYA
jgi:hypothetical protein